MAPENHHRLSLRSRALGPNFFLHSGEAGRGCLYLTGASGEVAGGLGKAFCSCSVWIVTCVPIYRRPRNGSICEAYPTLGRTRHTSAPLIIAATASQMRQLRSEWLGRSCAKCSDCMPPNSFFRAKVTGYTTSKKTRGSKS